MDQKAFVCKAIEAKQELYDRIADQIWQYAEAGMKEYRSAEYLERLAR